LPDDAFVFCSFNAFHKFSSYTIERWAAILRQTPGSVLWLLDGTATAKANLGAIMERHGVARDRIFHATKVLNPHHLARLPLADLVLDSLPYGAHTTASDALWMGVPVLTLRGRSFAARVCASLVKAAGTPEMITTTPDDFIDTAVMLAREPGQLGAVRAKLAAAKSSCLLFDQAKLANAIADLYAQMVEEYQAGNTPQPDLRNMDAYMRTALDHDHEATELSFAADYDDVRRARLAAIDRRAALETDTRLWRRGV
jgi:predicted O-linked N-acetylglucosamine transferase (SPINDLY family)